MGWRQVGGWAQVSSRHFSSEGQQTQTVIIDDLEQEALNIQNAIDKARDNIEKNTEKGRALSLEISKDVEEDKFIKMQRYNIFMSKMEQLQRAEKKWKRTEKNAVDNMQASFMNSQKPLKDILFYYNQACTKGFESSLVSKTLEQLKFALKARGNQPRVYEDYSTHDFDISWRMQLLISHVKTSLGDEQYFNHFFMGTTSRQLGEIGYKDNELIQKFFDKMNQMLDERENGSPSKKPLDFEQAVYGGFMNFVPRHYVFEGFQNSAEFQKYLVTLLDWQVEQRDGLKKMGIDSSQEIEDLEVALAHLIEATSQVKDMQLDMQASIDSLRQQYFKLQEAKDKFSFMEENRFIKYDLLELQELLVRSGYITPEEAEKYSPSQPYEARMERASRIFYEYVQNYVPELISPQYEDFFQAAESTRNERYGEKQQISLDEMHDKISLGSMSQTLIGLSNQALSYRKEAQGKDYLHKFYEDKADPGVIKDENDENFGLSHLWEPTMVRMERDYLKAWTTFDAEVEKITPRLTKLIKESNNDLEGQLHALMALSACKIEGMDTRKTIYDNIIKAKSLRKMQPRIQSLIDGIMGIAMQNSQTQKSKEAASKILNYMTQQLNSPSISLSFDQKIDILWSTCALGLESKTSLVRDLFEELNMMNFQRTHNDLNFQQFQKLKDILLYLTKVSPQKGEAWVTENKNFALELLMKNPQSHSMRYEESLANFDPFKKRVLQGLTRGLTMASIDHQVTQEADMFHQNQQDLSFNDNLYPYQPDVIVGYKGQKVLMEVIRSSQTMRDVQKADGMVVFRQRIQDALHREKDMVASVAIPITAIVKYDIANLKIKFQDNYNFLADMNDQIYKSTGAEATEMVIDLDHLSSFGSAFTRQAPHYMASLKNPADKKRANSFFKMLYNVFQSKQQTERQYEKIIFQQGLDSLKFELMKISLLFDQLPKHQQEYLAQFVPEEFEGDFKKMIYDQRDKITMRVKTGSVNVNEGDSKSLDLGWLGTRLDVELPPTPGFEMKKSIIPEMINQRFMWVDDYFHYNDWASQQQEVFDSFNLFVLPRSENCFKYFYDRANFQRIVPQGIFPKPNSKRVILQPAFNEYAQELLQTVENKNDILNAYEKEPHKMMILKELEKSQELKPINEKVSFITNLQNIKQGLKQDYSDKEILDLLLVNCQFTEGLIEKHLNWGSKQENDDDNTVFVDRCPTTYRNFIKETYFSKDQEDPFTHFYVKESGKVERMYKVYQDAEERWQDMMDNNDNPKTEENARKALKTLGDKVDDMLLQNQLENDDIISLNRQLKHEIKVNYNLKSLMKSEFVYDIDPELENVEMSDEMFLYQQRKRAETKLIKSRIIYKTFNGIDLSKNEKRYLRSWCKQIKSNKNVNLNNLRDTMLPRQPCKSSLGDSLSAEDIFAFNQIPNVSIDTSMHGKFALSDLILETSLFLDEEVINKVETEMMSSRMREEWNLPENFKVIETRNKEVGLVLNELEELAWRMSGMFDERDIDTVQKMFSAKRNSDYFDRQYYEQDMESLKDFMKNVNPYDDRIGLLENWTARKEEEISSRLVLPPKSLKKSDAVLHQQIDAKLKQARESIVSKLLIFDEFGNPAPAKSYADITTRELSQIVDSLCVRLNLFQGKYPSFMGPAVQAVMEHPNISNADYEQMSLFSKLFELDWRGDSSYENRQQWLAVRPVYLGARDRSNFIKYGDIGNFEAKAMIRQACTPFVEGLVNDLLQVAGNLEPAEKQEKENIKQ